MGNPTVERESPPYLSFSFFCFLTSLLEYNCFTMVYQFLLYNKVNQLYVYIYPISPPSSVSLPPSLPHPSRWSQSTELISLCYVAASHQLFYIWQCIYVHATLSLRPSLPFPHPVSSSLFTTSVSLLLSCPQVHQNPFFFLDSIYMCQHMVFVFLFLIYFTLYDRLQVHPPHYK